jgi:3-hydroxyisobutyrate dehydrogenase-like beta-hydroxyacid dehydrogenase
MLSIGIIGVGQLGTPVAKALLQAGHPVSIFDIDRARMEALAPLGAVVTSSARELASAVDVVITLLTYPEVVEEVVLGKDGILDGLRKESILIECSSIDDGTLRRISRKAEESGCRLVEAALIGRPQLVSRKQVLILTAGKELVVDECRPVFAAFAKKVLYAGEFGTAKALKIANALLNAAEIVVVNEALAWSLSNGITTEGFLGLLSERNPARANQLREILSGRLEKQQTWILKDLYHGLAMAAENEAPMPIASSVNAVVTLAKSENTEGYGLSEMVWKFYERKLQNQPSRKPV